MSPKRATPRVAYLGKNPPLPTSTASTPGLASYVSTPGFTPVVTSQLSPRSPLSQPSLGQQTWMATPRPGSSKLQSTGSFVVRGRAHTCPILAAPLSPTNPPGHWTWGTSPANPPGHPWWGPSYSMVPMPRDSSAQAPSDTDDAFFKATVVIRRTHAYLACACIAVALVALAVSTALSAAASPLNSTAADAAAAALMGGVPAGSMAGAANSTRARRARRLTEKYIQLRFENDVEALESHFADNIKLHVDLSRAGMLVAMKVKSLMGFHTELVGRDNVARYYRALPTESGDPMPKPNSFRCFNDACIVSCTVQRPLVGSVTDVGTLHWARKQDRLQRVDLSFWSR